MFHECLNFSFQPSFMRAAKESEKNLIHVIKVVRKKNDEKVENSRSVFKFSAQHSRSCKDCAVCRSKSLETLKDLKRHFESRHGVVITLKSISSDPEEPKEKPLAHKGAIVSEFWSIVIITNDLSTKDYFYFVSIVCYNLSIFFLFFSLTFKEYFLMGG